MALLTGNQGQTEGGSGVASQMKAVGTESMKAAETKRTHGLCATPKERGPGHLGNLEWWRERIEAWMNIPEH